MILRLCPRSRRRAKKVLRGGILVAGGFLLPAGLKANPAGGSVAAGSASITGQGTGAVTINQASNIAIINWQSFSINSGESTSFLQPGANSAALNRVLGGQTSLINGTLSANGQIYLINGNGVIVGPGGVINAGAFAASTRDITDADFLSGHLHFTGSSDAGVQNLGKIEALEGDIVLIGRTVDNEGTIQAPRGTAGLIAGNDVLLAQHNADGSTITVSPTSMAANAGSQVGVRNAGAITAVAAELKAANGNIYGLAVQNQGTIRATTVSRQGGHIWLTSDSGRISNSGKLDASATAPRGHGGEITLKSASGSVSHTGQMIARGGENGTGGSAELSAAHLQFSGTVDLTTQGGTRGTLLLDPATIDIVNGGGTDINASTIDPATVVAALNTADVVLSATLSITVDDLLDASANPNPGNLTLAAPNLQLNAPILLNGALGGSAGTVNEGPNALVQNGIDAIGAAGGTVNLAGGATYSLSKEIVINKIVDLEGNGATLSGQGATRIMEIDGGQVTLNGLTFTGGNGVSAAGVAGASWNGDGGALLVFGQNTTTQLSITNSTFLGNSANSGGAIFSVIISGGSNTLFLENDTFTANSAINGSVLYNYGSFGGNASISMKVDTIAGNSGTGAIYSTVLSSGNASVVINDSILAGNTAFSGESDYVDGGGGSLIDVGYNLYGQNGNAGGFVPGGSGTSILLAGDIGTVLGPAGLFGVPTPTLPLVALSPAIDAGDPAFVGVPDQRGVARGSLTQFTHAATDIGAFEAQFVSVQADPVTVVYGQTPVLTYTVTSGPATAVASLSGSPALITPATNVGNYGLDIGLGTLVSTPMYILDFTNGVLTITPRPVGVSPDAGQGKIYGTVDPVLTYTTSPVTATSGLVNGDTLSGSPSYAGAGQFTNVGDYATNLGTLANSNYAITLSSTAPTFSITPATLTYVADPVTVPADGTEFPAFTGSVTGFVGADTLATATTGNPFFFAETEPGAPAGSYPITGSGLSANFGNYQFVQAPGNDTALTIGETAPVVPPDVSVPGEPNTPVSQALAQTSSSTTTETDTSLPGGTGTPLVPPAPLTVDMNVSAISPNEFIDSTPGSVTSDGSVFAGALAQGSSFDPGVGDTSPVAVGQTVTLAGGGTHGAPPPPIVAAQLAQVLGTQALDTLNSALASVGAASDQGAAASTSGAGDQTSGSSGGGSPGSPSNPNPNGSTGPVTEIAPGQTISITSGKAGNLPPPAPVQAAFDQGFSPASRDTLSQAAGK